MTRQTGFTTEQMKNAPRNAIYVWVNSDLYYPVKLSQRLGRDDLEIVRPSWLETGAWYGRTLSGIVIDHAVTLSVRQHECLSYARLRIRNTGNN